MWNIGLNPGLEGAKYNCYKEAWHLLGGEKPGFVARIEACAEVLLRGFSDLSG